MNEKWYKCDDTYVNEIPEQSINNQLAYLLLYEKIEEDVLNKV